jgi:hypothetical protein
MRSLRRISSVLFITVVFCFAAYADTLDFSLLPVGPQSTTTLVLPNATLTSYGVDFYAGAAGVNKEICALSFGGNCEADIKIVFNQLVSFLTLQTYGYDNGDYVDFLAYDASNNLIGSVLNINSDTTVTGLSGFSNISTLMIDDHSTGAGFGYDNFQFTTSSAVPEPAFLPLMGLGFGLIGLASWRIKK